MSRDTRGGALGVLPAVVGALIPTAIVIAAIALLIYVIKAEPAQELKIAEVEAAREKYRIDDARRIEEIQRANGMSEQEIAADRQTRQNQYAEMARIELEKSKQRGETAEAENPLNQLKNLAPWIIGGVALYAFLPLLLELGRGAAEQRRFAREARALPAPTT